MLLRTIIVEDEPLSQHYLSMLLRHLPMIEVIGNAATEEEAIETIHSLKPDLVFMDIELHSGTGFEALRKTEGLNYSVIFTTALEQHAIKIIKLSGVAFLQKPIDADELYSSIKKVADEVTGGNVAVQYLLQTLENNNTPQHIALHQTGRVAYIHLNEVLFIVVEEASVFHLESGECHPDLRSLKEIETLLSEFYFFRVSAKYIVSLAKIDSVSLSGDSVILVNGASIPLSPKKREALTRQLARL